MSVVRFLPCARAWNATASIAIGHRRRDRAPRAPDARARSRARRRRSARTAADREAQLARHRARARRGCAFARGSPAGVDAAAGRSSRGERAASVGPSVSTSRYLPMPADAGDRRADELAQRRARRLALHVERPCRCPTPTRSARRSRASACAGRSRPREARASPSVLAHARAEIAAAQRRELGDVERLAAPAAIDAAVAASAASTAAPRRTPRAARCAASCGAGRTRRGRPPSSAPRRRSARAAARRPAATSLITVESIFGGGTNEPAPTFATGRDVHVGPQHHADRAVRPCRPAARRSDRPSPSGS